MQPECTIRAGTPDGATPPPLNGSLDPRARLIRHPRSASAAPSRVDTGCGETFGISLLLVVGLLGAIPRAPAGPGRHASRYHSTAPERPRGRLGAWALWHGAEALSATELAPLYPGTWSRRPPILRIRVGSCRARLDPDPGGAAPQLRLAIPRRARCRHDPGRRDGTVIDGAATTDWRATDVRRRSRLQHDEQPVRAVRGARLILHAAARVSLNHGSWS
jgi:hypothetical protein